MATFTSPATTIDSSAQAVVEKFGDLTRLKEVIEKIPAAERAKIGDLDITSHAIIMQTAQVGAITLRVTERTPSGIKLVAEGSPVPMSLSVNVKPLTPESCELVASMDVDIPVSLKPMVGGTLQKAVDQLGALMGRMA